MPYLRPCAHCPHRIVDDVRCPIKAEKLDIIRAAKLGIVEFKCDKRLSGLPPGQRVRLEMIEYGSALKEYKGTIMRPHKNRVLIWLDELSPHGHNPVALAPDRVFPVPGPLVKLCPDCGQPKGTKGRDKWYCWNRACLNWSVNPLEEIQHA